MGIDWVGVCIGSGITGGIIGMTLSSKVTLFLPLSGSLINFVEVIRIKPLFPSNLS